MNAVDISTVHRKPYARIFCISVIDLNQNKYNILPKDGEKISNGV